MRFCCVSVLAALYGALHRTVKCRNGIFDYYDSGMLSYAYRSRGKAKTGSQAAVVLKGKTEERQMPLSFIFMLKFVKI